MLGKIEVLNATHGHKEVVFKDAAEAKQQIDDMLKKGYSIFVEADGTTEKVSGFDEKTGEYLIHKVQTIEVVKRVPLASAKASAVAPIAGG